MTILHINVVSAKDIPPKARNKKRNVSLSLKLGDTIQETSVKRKTLQPVWNESFDFPYKPSKLYRLTLEVTLWDNDKKGSHFIGKIEFPLKQFTKKFFSLDTETESSSQDLNLHGYSPCWYDLESSFPDDPFPGRLCLGIYCVDSFGKTILPSAFDEASQELTEKTPIHIEPSPLKYSVSTNSELLSDRSLKGIIKLHIIGAHDLPTERRILSSHSLNPLIIISFSKMTYKTKAIRRCLNPIWKEKLIFPIKNTESNYDINFALYDCNKLRNNTLVATGSMKAATLFGNPNEVQKMTLSLLPTKPCVNFPQCSPVLVFTGNFIPAKVLRYNFWNALSKIYDHDENGRLNRIELLTMLESIGSTLTESSINAIFSRFSEQEDAELSMEEVVNAMEAMSISTITAPHVNSSVGRKSHSRSNSKNVSDPESLQLIISNANASPATMDTGASALLAPHYTLAAISSPTLPLNESSSTADSSSGSASSFSSLRMGESMSENIVCLKECPICFKPWTKKHKDIDVITHLSICTSEEPTTVDRFVMGGFLTEEYASRKWYTKVISFLGYGGYNIGKNNGHVFVQNRVTGKLIEEKIPTYIRLGIRLVYQSMASGRAVESKMVRQLLQYLTHKQGRKFNDPNSVKHIMSFIHYHSLNIDEILLDVSSFKTFNEFFYRKLKPGARTLCTADSHVAVSPADCRISVFQTISESTRLWIKGTNFSVGNLLQDQSMARYYDGGSIVICRLAPQDYHRFHSPVDGSMGIIIPLPGSYYTVNPMAVRQKLDVFTENARSVSYLISDFFGKVAYVAVGAMFVASVNFTVSQGEKISRLDELGYFAFGGSTVILVFAKDTITLDADLIANSSQQLETLIKVGDSIGTAVVNTLTQSLCSVSPLYASNLSSTSSLHGVRSSSAHLDTVMNGQLASASDTSPCYNDL